MVRTRRSAWFEPGVLYDRAVKYLRRRLDDYLDEVFPALPAIAIDGARGVGKTETARRRVAAVFRLDEAESARLLAAGGRSVLESEPSVLLDEWQKYRSCGTGRAEWSTTTPPPPFC